MFNPVAHYGYLLPNMYLFIADITNPDSFVRSSASHPHESWQCPFQDWLAKNGISGPHWWVQGSTQFAQQTAVCDISTACRLCRLEPAEPVVVVYQLP